MTVKTKVKMMMLRRAAAVTLAGVCLASAGCAPNDRGSDDLESQAEASSPARSSGRPDDLRAPQGAPAARAQVTSGGIEVVGTGSASATPDTLSATVGVQVREGRPGAALASSSRRARAVIDAAVAAGVDRSDVQTSQLSLTPEFGDPAGPVRGPQEISGYVATNLVELRIVEVDRAGEILAAAVDAGGATARVQGVSLSVDADDGMMAAARESAFDDARARAQQYAQLAGAELGELISVSEQGSQPGVSFSARASDAVSVPIEPGTEQVEVQVTAVWAISHGG